MKQISKMWMLKWLITNKVQKMAAVLHVFLEIQQHCVYLLTIFYCFQTLQISMEFKIEGLLKSKIYESYK